MRLFQQMLNIKPDNFTVVALLTGCAQVGELEQRNWIHEHMNEHRISIDANPKEKDDILVPVYGALLSACRLYGDVDMSEHLADRLMKIEVGDSSIHTLLANIYASVERWEDVKKVTSKMRVSGVRKEPGCRSIEVNDDIHEFLVGDASHPELKDVYFSLKTDTCKDQRPLSS
nr:hypothetical protein [Tanacetum cinerariifolium]